MVSKQTMKKLDNSMRPKMFKFKSDNPPWNISRKTKFRVQNSDISVAII